MNVFALLFLLIAIVLGCAYVVRNHVGFAVAALSLALILQFAGTSHTVHF